jgi:leucine dehydrogenase
MAGLQVVVQGLGAVGSNLCTLLAQSGARLQVTDVVPARAAAVAAATGAEILAPELALSSPCDVFAPCALGGVLSAATAARLPARAVCGAANNIFGDGEAAAILHQRGVLVVPDFVANAGALIQGATWHLTGQRTGAERLRRIGETAGELLDRARREAVPPSVLALQVARERVERASA